MVRTDGSEDFGTLRPTDSDSARADAAWRSNYAIDIDRLLYSPEFRRLSGVTQVSSPQADYVFHDRLTHSLKVAQIAQRLAESVTERANRVDYDVSNIIDPDVCYAAGLAHDLGHPPFGHAAEAELQRILGADTDSPTIDDSFEGNAQSFRIVAKLSFRKAKATGGEGLNLTWRVLAALSKYPWLKNEHPPSSPKLASKWGFYATEKSYFEYMLRVGLIWPHGPNASLRQSAEAQIMDWADDITYAVHDLQDYFRAQQVPLHSIKQWISASEVDARNMPERQLLLAYARQKIRASVKDSWTGVPSELSDEKIDQVIAEISLKLPSTSFSGSRVSQEDLNSFGSFVIALLMDEAEIEKSPEGRYFLRVSETGQIVAEFLKSILKYYVIITPSMYATQSGQRRVIRDLFEYYHAAAILAYSPADQEEFALSELPQRLTEYLKEVRTDSGEPYHNRKARTARAAVDFLCTLTDRQASLLHQRTSGDSVASLPNYWLNV